MMMFVEDSLGTVDTSKLSNVPRWSHPFKVDPAPGSQPTADLKHVLVDRVRARWKSDLEHLQAEREEQEQAALDEMALQMSSADFGARGPSAAAPIPTRAPKPLSKSDAIMAEEKRKAEQQKRLQEEQELSAKKEKLGELETSLKEVEGKLETLNSEKHDLFVKLRQVMQFEDYQRAEAARKVEEERQRRLVAEDAQRRLAMSSPPPTGASGPAPMAPSPTPYGHQFPASVGSASQVPPMPGNYFQPPGSHMAPPVPHTHDPHGPSGPQPHMPVGFHPIMPQPGHGASQAPPNQAILAQVASIVNQVQTMVSQGALSASGGMSAAIPHPLPFVPDPRGQPGFNASSHGPNHHGLSQSAPPPAHPTPPRDNRYQDNRQSTMSSSGGSSSNANRGGRPPSPHRSGNNRDDRWQSSPSSSSHDNYTSNDRKRTYTQFSDYDKNASQGNSSSSRYNNPSSSSSGSNRPPYDSRPSNSGNPDSRSGNSDSRGGNSSSSNRDSRSSGNNDRGNDRNGPSNRGPSQRPSYSSNDRSSGSGSRY